MELFQDMIPNDCLPIIGFRMAGYYTPEGNFAYQISTEQEGSIPLATFLGMLDMVKHEFLSVNDVLNKDRDNEEDD